MSKSKDRCCNVFVTNPSCGCNPQPSCGCQSNWGCNNNWNNGCNNNCGGSDGFGNNSWLIIILLLFGGFGGCGI